MRLHEYFEKKGSKTPQEIAEESGVSYTTVKSARRGMAIKLYDVAQRISAATGGKVTVRELCEEKS